uniref:Uncharacterized protein n=1 Tax=Mycena chlorophos TaxID=658473 RepID=A0ABQ0LN37_MYCCL|nr:predicted protein [Mycena chlorophos]
MPAPCLLRPGRDVRRVGSGGHVAAFICLDSETTRKRPSVFDLATSEMALAVAHDDARTPACSSRRRSKSAPLSAIMNVGSSRSSRATTISARKPRAFASLSRSTPSKVSSLSHAIPRVGLVVGCACGALVLAAASQVNIVLACTLNLRIMDDPTLQTWSPGRSLAGRRHEELRLVQEPAGDANDKTSPRARTKRIGSGHSSGRGPERTCRFSTLFTRRTATGSMTGIAVQRPLGAQLIARTSARRAGT